MGNYFAAALRNLLRNRVYAAINLFGLSLGFAAALLIALYVRDELSYDRFFPGYRDVYLLTETKDYIDRRLPAERWDFSSPDLAAKLSAQFPQIATVARVMTPDDPPHIRHGQVAGGRDGLPLGGPVIFSGHAAEIISRRPQTALAAPDSVVLTRTAARKYFGRDMPLGELLEVNPAMGADAAKVSTAFSTPHPMRVAAVIEDLPSNSYVKGEVFGSSLAAYSRVRAVRSHTRSGAISDERLYLHPPAAWCTCAADATGTLRLCSSQRRPFTHLGSPLDCI